MCLFHMVIYTLNRVLGVTVDESGLNSPKEGQSHPFPFFRLAHDTVIRTINDKQKIRQRRFMSIQKYSKNEHMIGMDILCPSL